jgi:hypothetical protein
MEKTSPRLGIEKMTKKTIAQSDAEVQAMFNRFADKWNEPFDSEPFTDKNILRAIEKAKMTNGWALTDKTEITFDHDSEMVVVWNAEGDYDAHYQESDIEGIKRELEFIENFVYEVAN